MTTTAITWFYNDPGNNANNIAERVRTTLWEARLGSLWLDVVSAETPYKMQGTNNSIPIEIEWVPGKTFTLRTQTDQPLLVERLSFVLAFPAAFSYTDSDNYTLYEWRRNDADERWRMLNGNPQYQNLKRLQG